MRYRLSYLDSLESESVSIFREVAENFENPVILFSGGKDSVVLIHLAIRAFWPARIPMKVVHIDTGHNFKEAIDFRDNFAKDHRLDLEVFYVEDSIKQGLAIDEPMGPNFSRNKLQSITLMNAIENNKFDALIGGARRDEEKARSKERFFSHRNEFGEWDPKNQRVEAWDLFNCKMNPGEHFRVFPLNNWTEIDIWNYIKEREIELPSLYYSHEREVFERDEILYAHSDIRPINDFENVKKEIVRFRTVGDITCTGAVKSEARTVEDIINEILASQVTERGYRADDKRSACAMEERKREGYF